MIPERASYEPATPICTYPMPSTLVRSWSTMPATASTGSVRSKSTGASSRPSTAPETSHTAAARDGECPMKVSRTDTAMTYAARGLAAYTSALGPGPALTCPTTMTSPASVSRRTASEMVGLDSPVSSRRSARVSSPRSSRWESAAISFIARSRREEPARWVKTVPPNRQPS